MKNSQFSLQIHFFVLDKVIATKIHPVYATAASSHACKNSAAMEMPMNERNATN